MKIQKTSAGILTNFEVLEFLRSRGATTDPTLKLMSKVTSSEYKIFDYLVDSAALNQTKECIAKFAEKAKQFRLAQADIINIVNNRPLSDEELVELAPMIEQYEERLGDNIAELLEIVKQVLPPHPKKKNSEEGAGAADSAESSDADKEDNGEEQMDTC